VVPAKVDAPPGPAIAPVNREAAAVVDQKSEIKGTLHSQGNVLVEGCFEGEIEAKETVWVEKGAQTQAQLRATDVIVSGTFNGEIDCRRRLQIAATATISGEIKTPVLVIEEGATVNCRFSMTRSGGKSK
jgi:cytoskeletal protein CcmA (bactofilin family)